MPPNKESNAASTLIAYKDIGADSTWRHDPVVLKARILHREILNSDEMKASEAERTSLKFPIAIKHAAAEVRADTVLFDAPEDHFDQAWRVIHEYCDGIAKNYMPWEHRKKMNRISSSVQKLLLDFESEEELVWAKKRVLQFWLEGISDRTVKESSQADWEITKASASIRDMELGDLWGPLAGIEHSSVEASEQTQSSGSATGLNLVGEEAANHQQVGASDYSEESAGMLRPTRKFMDVAQEKVFRSNPVVLRARLCFHSIETNELGKLSSAVLEDAKNILEDLRRHEPKDPGHEKAFARMREYFARITNDNKKLKPPGGITLAMNKLLPNFKEAAEENQAKMIALQYWLKKFEDFVPRDTTPRQWAALHKQATEWNERLQAILPEASMYTFSEARTSNSMPSTISPNGAQASIAAFSISVLPNLSAATSKRSISPSMTHSAPKKPRTDYTSTGTGATSYNE
ncbi:hypothetical protein QFC24_004075 [Naganishia onofrii]|uniref:Uncharacterized protein n=1 Tax=Naganishia onofrii TaxID=1851511 RepID=A0ACC2XFF6_9TREE|nr:hypothetical protein QFC24_004075 [Naganishia onofrii]